VILWSQDGKRTLKSLTIGDKIKISDEVKMK